MTEELENGKVPEDGSASESPEEAKKPKQEELELSDDEVQKKAFEAIKASLPPGLRRVVEQDPSQMAQILQWGGQLVEDQLIANQEGEGEPEQSPQKGRAPKRPTPKEGEEEKDFLDRAYEYMQSKAWEDKQAGMSEEEIRRRHWRRDFELRQSVSERQARGVLEAEQSKNFQMQQFFAQNPDFNAPGIAQEVVRRVNQGENIAKIHRELQPIIDQQKMFYGVQDKGQDQGGQVVNFQNKSRRRLSPEQYDTYADVGGDEEVRRDDYIKEAKNEFKQMLDKVKPGEEFTDALWKKARDLMESR